MERAHGGANGGKGEHGANILGGLFRAQPRASAFDGAPVPRSIADPVAVLPPSPPPKPPSAVDDRLFGAPPESNGYAHRASAGYSTDGVPQGSMDRTGATRPASQYTSQAPRAGFPLGTDGTLREAPPGQNVGNSASVLVPAYADALRLDLPETPTAAGRKRLSVTRSTSDGASALGGEDKTDAAVLNGYNPNTWDPPLRYGDSVSLLVDGLNAVTAYSGSEDGRAWIELLKVCHETVHHVASCAPD